VCVCVFGVTREGQAHYSIVGKINHADGAVQWVSYPDMGKNHE